MKGDGQGRRLSEGHVVGYGVCVDGGGNDVLCVAAVEVDADALLAGAPLVVSRGAIFAQVDAAAFHTVVDKDAVADFQVGAGVGADLHDLAGQVAAEDVGETAAVAGPQVEVEVVEGAAADVYEYFAGGDFRIWAVTVGEHLGAARFIDVNGFHRVPSALQW